MYRPRLGVAPVSLDTPSVGVKRQGPRSPYFSRFWLNFRLEISVFIPWRRCPPSPAGGGALGAYQAGVYEASLRPI
jgi:hypothetical protein